MTKRFVKTHKTINWWAVLDNDKELLEDEVVELLNALNEENEQLKAQLKDCEKRVTDKEVEWLRNNTVWEQMPSNKRTFITTSAKEDYK